MDLNWWVENIPGYQRNYHGNKDAESDLTNVEIRGLVKELSIINHISSDDPPTFMSYGMNPNASIPEDPKRARGWSIHHVKFGMVMEQRLKQEGVEVVLKYPNAQPAFTSDVPFLIHHFRHTGGKLID